MLGFYFVAYLVWCLAYEFYKDPIPKWEGSGMSRGGASPAQGMAGESNMVDAAMFMNINE